MERTFIFAHKIYEEKVSCHLKPKEIKKILQKVFFLAIRARE